MRLHPLSARTQAATVRRFPPGWKLHSPEELDVENSGWISKENKNNSRYFAALGNLFYRKKRCFLLVVVFFVVLSDFSKGPPRVGTPSHKLPIPFPYFKQVLSEWYGSSIGMGVPLGSGSLDFPLTFLSRKPWHSWKVIVFSTNPSDELHLKWAPYSLLKSMGVDYSLGWQFLTLKT